MLFLGAHDGKNGSCPGRGHFDTGAGVSYNQAAPLRVPTKRSPELRFFRRHLEWVEVGERPAQARAIADSFLKVYGGSKLISCAAAF